MIRGGLQAGGQNYAGNGSGCGCGNTACNGSCGAGGRGGLFNGGLFGGNGNGFAGNGMANGGMGNGFAGNGMGGYGGQGGMMANGLNLPAIGGHGMHGQAIGSGFDGSYNGMIGHGGHLGGAVAGVAGAMVGCGRFGCGSNGVLCLACKLRNLTHRQANHPYGGQIPHTAHFPDGGMGGNGAAAPTYAYPYYTTRGPRDFLQDSCAPNPVVPYAPKTICVPSIGW